MPKRLDVWHEVHRIGPAGPGTSSSALKSSAQAVWRSCEVNLGGRRFRDTVLGVLGETRSFGGNAGAPNMGPLVGVGLGGARA